MSYRDSLITALEIECFELGIDPTIVDAIFEIESSWNPWSFRFEPKWKYFYKSSQFAKVLRITHESELTGQQISWGLGQIMGGTAREMGYTDLLPRLCDPQTNIQIVCRMVRRLLDKYKDLGTAIAVYNGGPGKSIKGPDGLFVNQVHVDKFFRAYTRLRDDLVE